MEKQQTISVKARIISNEIIDNFISHYQREVVYYDTLARECADRCRKMVEAAGIKAIVTHRAKSPQSLYQNLLKRHREKFYKDAGEIRNDNRDLAGVRIALFFTDNQDVVEDLLHEHFEIVEVFNHKETHKAGTSSDYHGIHFMVRMPREKRPNALMQDDVIEVQVMSLLHNVWSEIQHDIEYKPHSSIVDEKIKDDLHKLFVYSQDGEVMIKGIYQNWRQRGVMWKGYLTNTPLEKLQVSSLIKGEAPAPLYWYSQDGRRYLFPTDLTLQTWFPDPLPKIFQVTNSELNKVPIGGNVTYKPGVRLIRIVTDPKIYAVEKGGVLRWIKSEKVIEEIYGKEWQALVDIIPDPFFVNYSSGPDIDSVSDHNPKEQRESASELDIGFVQPRHPCIFPGEIVPPINVGEASVPENSQ